MSFSDQHHLSFLMVIFIPNFTQAALILSSISLRSINNIWIFRDFTRVLEYIFVKSNTKIYFLLQFLYVFVFLYSLRNHKLFYGESNKSKFSVSFFSIVSKLRFCSSQSFAISFAHESKGHIYQSHGTFLMLIGKLIRNPATNRQLN